jgi:hypothetical protein
MGLRNAQNRDYCSSEPTTTILIFFVFIFSCSCQLGWKGNDWFIANLNRFFKAANLRQEFCHRIWQNKNKCNLDNRWFLLSWRISLRGTFRVLVLVFSVMRYKSQLKLDKRSWEFLHVNKSQKALLIQHSIKWRID